MDITTNPNINQEYMNPLDGKTYTIKQNIPGQGAIMVDKVTNEESMLPQDQVTKMQQTPTSGNTPNPDTTQGLKPVLKTQTNNRRNVMATDFDQKNDHMQDDQLSDVPDEVQDHIMEDINTTIDNIEVKERGIEGDIDSILEDTGLFNEMAEAQDEDPTEVIKSVEVPGGPQTENVSKDKVDEFVNADTDRNAHPLSELNKNLLASNVVPPKVESVRKSWRDIRASFAPFGPKTFEQRQALFVKKAGLKLMAKDLGFSPDKRDADDSGHSKVNGIPVSGPKKEKDKVIGLTDFPKGEKRDDSVGLDTGKGYNIPIKDMDEKQVADREKFDNEQRQMITRMTIREFRELMGNKGKEERESIEKGRGLQQEREPVKSEKSRSYDDIETEAILKSVGLFSLSADEEQSIPKTPVTLDEKKTAPKSDAYTEPAMIPPAEGKVKEAITKLMRTQEELDALKSQLDSLVKPHQEAIKLHQQERLPGIKEKSDLLQSYIDMAYNQIDATSEKVVYYAKQIYTRLSEIGQTKPQVTVAQIIDEAVKIDETLANNIMAIKERLEALQGGSVEKRRLYKFPVTPSTEKKLSPESSLKAMSFDQDQIIAALAQFIAGLAEVSMDIMTAIKNIADDAHDYTYDKTYKAVSGEEPQEHI